MTIDGERVSSPILKTENGWVVRVYEEDSTTEEIEFLYPNLTDDSEFSLLFVSSGDDIDDDGGTGGGLCDCEPYELTAEAVQAVVPMAWDAANTVYGTEAVGQIKAVAIGHNAKAYGTRNVVVGLSATSGTNYNVVVGADSQSYGIGNVSIGDSSLCKEQGNPTMSGSIAVGAGAQTIKPTSITMGATFSDTSGDFTCTTEGTGSITIGAGANTKNSTKTVDGVETTVESSNSITIGCKASNSGADSVVIGAQAGGKATGGITIGAGAKSSDYSTVIGTNAKAAYMGVVLGSSAKAEGYHAVALGREASAYGGSATALGKASTAKGLFSVALGYRATVSDQGATVIRSTAEDDTYTQLYFSGANTPLANTYENGEAMMGYVVSKKVKETNETGKEVEVTKVLAAGTNKLSALFPNNSTFQPATLDEFGEWVQPKVFHPSDLDLPIEEPIEEEEYQPLPVYPIVEPEIDELMIQE